MITPVKTFLQNSKYKTTLEKCLKHAFQLQFSKASSRSFPAGKTFHIFWEIVSTRGFKIVKLIQLKCIYGRNLYLLYFTQNYKMCEVC